ncbi:MAG: DUF1801 domain-containing protein [Pseudomonadota bacterium]
MDQDQFADKSVEAVFEGYPELVREKLLSLRTLIFETARATDGVGPLDETLKWGQPSYLTPDTRSGSTIRIDQVRKRPDSYAVYFHCQSGLVPLFKELYKDELQFDGKRAILLNIDTALPEEPLRHCVALALTHHLRKKQKAKM